MPALIDQIAAFCERHHLLPHGTTIVVAVSGGPDSLCLLHVLRQLAPRRQMTLHVAHLDHQLRPNSADDARFVEEIAVLWELPITVDQIDVAQVAQQHKSGIEAAARAVRYTFLHTVADQIGAQAIAVGHNADDQAETVLLRLLRGAGSNGLAAMRPRRAIAPGSSINLIRPLLETPRAEIEAYCTEHNLQPRHDQSNLDPIYLRNRVRGYILPLLKTYNSNIITTLGRTARVCAEESDLIDHWVTQTWDTLATVALDGRSVSFDRQQFDQVHPALQRRIIRKAAFLLAPGIELEARHIDLALAAIADQRRGVQLPRRLYLAIRRKQLQLITRQDQVV